MRYVDTIDCNSIYGDCKKSIIPLYEKYCRRNNGNIFLWKNSPITRFACDYSLIGKRIIKENGYLGGRYRKKKGSFKYKVRVRKGFRSSFGSEKKDTHL
jgi:hypothetical protein